MFELACLRFAYFDYREAFQRHLQQLFQEEDDCHCPELASPPLEAAPHPLLLSNGPPEEAQETLLEQQASRDPEVDKKWRYLFLRRHLLLYPLHRLAGWPIGSGMVESAHKVVWQTRLKGPGMRWAAAHVNPLLALRTSVCNDRWDEAWQQGCEHQGRLRLHARQQRAHPRLHALVSSWLLLLLRFHPSAPKPSRPALPHAPEPPATLSGSWRPSAHHPWKRGPACRPRLIAKT